MCYPRNVPTGFAVEKRVPASADDLHPTGTVKGQRSQYVMILGSVRCFCQSRDACLNFQLTAMWLGNGRKVLVGFVSAQCREWRLNVG